MNIIPSKGFTEEAKKFLRKSPQHKEKLTKTLNLLRANCRHPSLRLHKLSGGENYSVSIDRSIRIIVHLDGENIFLLRIGTHDEVY